MGRDHALSGIGNQIAGRQATIAPLVPLRNIVAYAGGAERESDETSLLASLRHLAGQLVGMQVAEVALQGGWSAGPGDT